jgi:hypothetical protein
VPFWLTVKKVPIGSNTTPSSVRHATKPNLPTFLNISLHKLLKGARVHGIISLTSRSAGIIFIGIGSAHVTKDKPTAGSNKFIFQYALILSIHNCLQSVAICPK